MNVYCPHTKALTGATRRALIGAKPKYVEMTDDEAYWRYLRDLWIERETFINVEHDVVPWPGALEELWGCGAPVCAYGYMPYDDLNSDSYNVFMGCIKFSDRFILSSPMLWANTYERCWWQLDGVLTKYLRGTKRHVHQHYPAVLNIGQGHLVRYPET